MSEEPQLRDGFASGAMQGFLSADPNIVQSVKQAEPAMIAYLARLSFMIADAMMEARKTGGTK